MMSAMFVDLESLSDEALVEEAEKGSEQAFGLLFDRHFERIFGLAYKLCSTREDAMDVTQETFANAARSLKTFRGEAPFSAWLSRICVNAARGWHRCLARQRDLLKEFHRRRSAEVYLDAKAREVIEALELLPQIEREIVLLTLVEGYTHREVADLLGKAESTVSWRIFKAKKKLREAFRGENNG